MRKLLTMRTGPWGNRFYHMFPERTSHPAGWVAAAGTNPNPNPNPNPSTPSQPSTLNPSLSRCSLDLSEASHQIVIWADIVVAQYIVFWFFTNIIWLNDIAVAWMSLFQHLNFWTPVTNKRRTLFHWRTSWKYLLEECAAPVVHFYEISTAIRSTKVYYWLPFFRFAYYTDALVALWEK